MAGTSQPTMKTPMPVLAMAWLIAGADSTANAMPRNPPSAHNSTDSPNTIMATFRLEKPSVFNTASSGMRSRNAWLIVFAVSSRMVKNTAERIPVVMRPMSPICAANWRPNSSSVADLTGFREFSNRPSMALEISGARSGSLTRNVHQPTEPWPNWRASSK